MSELLLHMLKLKLSAFPKEKATHVTLDLLLLVTFCLCNTTVQCQKRSISHISADPPSSSVAPDYRSRFERIFLSILLGLIAGLIFSVLFACVVRCFIRYLGRTPILKGPVIFSPKIAPKTLQSALAKDNQLLGSSPNGKYYKTVLEDGLTVAVKRLEPFENGSPEKHCNSVKRRMQEELEMLAGLRHRNLMSLRAFVREPDRFCLVYDYMPMGSLEDAMKRVRDNELKLSWELRLRIAVGIVKGLHFLHFSCAPKILHHNLKPNNVLLDAEFEPRLADCGLAKLMPNLDREVSAYSAPECLQNCRYTDKSDVFSFGVILGVLLTGRNATDTFSVEGSSGGSLGQWLQHLQQAGEPQEALDKSIIGEEVEEEEMLMAVRIAVVCQSNFPADRPSSDELVSMLTQLHSF